MPVQVNEQNNEIENIEEQIHALQEQVSCRSLSALNAVALALCSHAATARNVQELKYAAESGEDVHQHKQMLAELESKLQATERMAEKYELKGQDLQRIIESLRRGVQSLYDKMAGARPNEVRIWWVFNACRFCGH